MSYGELEASLVRENRALREQNRVLRKALEDIVKADWAEPAGIAKAALTTTSQPKESK